MITIGKTIITFSILLISITGFGQKNVLESLLWNGENEQVIELGKNQLQSANNANDSLAIYTILTEAYLQTNHYPKHLKCLAIKRKLNCNKTKADILYYIELANYYHHQLWSDSANFFCNKSMDLLRENPTLYSDSNLVFQVYSKYGNCSRNKGRMGLNRVALAGYSYAKILFSLDKYHDTALFYATNNFQLADLYHKKATVALDYIARKQFSIDTLTGPQALKKSNDYYLKSIGYSSSPSQIASAYSLMGLNHHYMKNYLLSDSCYNKAIKALPVHTNGFLYRKMAIYNWQGWNMYEWYNTTGDTNKLNSVISLFKKNIEVWNLYASEIGNNKKGFNDGYRVGAMSKLAVSLAQKFLITGDSTYLLESFHWADLTKYPQLNNREFSFVQLQEGLDSTEVFLQNVTAFNPAKELFFIVSKENVSVVVFDKKFKNHLPKKTYSKDEFSDHSRFKLDHYILYLSKFKEVQPIIDSLGKTSIIVCNSEYNPMLNYDLFLTDTTSNLWRDYPFLFHKYNFSYSLCVRNFINENADENPVKLGITLGKYDDDIDLRFSKSMVKQLENSYRTIQNPVINNDCNFWIYAAHGNSSYSKSEGQLKIASNKTLSVNDIYKMKLNTDFVMITTCGSNSSKVFYGEGSSGNFAKAFAYAGVDATLTTSWDIDDKANALITTSYLANLASGHKKNDALWLAKKEYWNNQTQDEGFNPFYWAPYILNGNTKPIKLQPAKKNKYAWWSAILLLPIGYWGYRKSRKKN